MFKLAVRSLLRHPWRAILTIGSLCVAIFLLCVLRSLLTTMDAGVEAANRQRLWVQSAVSLFIDLPLPYQTKIAEVPGVRRVVKWQWFGGYYQDRSNFFAQFAVDPAPLFEMWPEAQIVEGSREEFLADRRACVIGQGLASDFGWKVGSTIPIIGTIFALPDESAWEFQVAAIYRATKPSIDDRTLFFHWDRLEKTVEDVLERTPSVGVYVLELDPGADAARTMASVDALFENGPQRVQTMTEAAFQRQFVTMLGNLPRLLGFIGGAVLIAVLLACVNTMLLQAREQLREIGVLKALGFSDGSSARLLLLQSLALCAAGGVAGIGLALLTEAPLANLLARNFPGYEVKAGTFAMAVVATLFVGFVSGAVPSRLASRLRPVEALRPH